MDESCVLLVNLHQLLVRFVPHAELRVCCHCNEVGYTLHRRDNKRCDVHMHAFIFLFIKQFKLK